MYWTTPSGDEVPDRLAVPRRARQSVELIAIAAPPERDPLPGQPLVGQLVPGPGDPDEVRELPEVLGVLPREDLGEGVGAVMKNSSSSGRSARMSRRVSIVNVGPGRSMSTLLTVKRGLEAVAMTVMR